MRVDGGKQHGSGTCTTTQGETEGKKGSVLESSFLTRIFHFVNEKVVLRRTPPVAKSAGVHIQPRGEEGQRGAPGLGEFGSRPGNTHTHKHTHMAFRLAGKTNC